MAPFGSAQIAAPTKATYEAEGATAPSAGERPLMSRVWSDGCEGDAKVVLADGRALHLWSLLLRHVSPFFDDRVGRGCAEGQRHVVDCTHLDAWSVETLLEWAFFGGGRAGCSRHRAHVLSCPPSLPAYVRLCRTASALGMAVPSQMVPLLWRRDGALRAVVTPRHVVCRMHHGGHYRVFESVLTLDDSATGRDRCWRATTGLSAKINSFLGLRGSATCDLLFVAGDRRRIDGMVRVRVGDDPEEWPLSAMDRVLAAWLWRSLGRALDGPRDGDRPIAERDARDATRSERCLWYRVCHAGLEADTRVVSSPPAAAGGRRSHALAGRLAALGPRLPSFLLRLLSPEVEGRLHALGAGPADGDRFVLDCSDLDARAVSRVLRHALGDGCRAHRHGGRPCRRCHAVRDPVTHGRDRRAAQALGLGCPSVLDLSMRRHLPDDTLPLRDPRRRATDRRDGRLRERHRRPGHRPDRDPGYDADRSDHADDADCRPAAAVGGEDEDRDGREGRAQDADDGDADDQDSSGSSGEDDHDDDGVSDRSADAHRRPSHQRILCRRPVRVKHRCRFARITLDPVVGLVMFRGGAVGPFDTCKLEARVGDELDPNGNGVDGLLPAPVEFEADAGTLHRLNAWMGGGRARRLATALDRTAWPPVLHVVLDASVASLPLSKHDLHRWDALSVDLAPVIASAAVHW